MKGAKLTVASLIAGGCPPPLSLLPSLCHLEVDYNLNDASLTWLVSGRHNKCQVNEYFIAIHLRGGNDEKGGGRSEIGFPLCAFSGYIQQYRRNGSTEVRAKRKLSAKIDDADDG